jgi:hypothetical protein
MVKARMLNIKRAWYYFFIIILIALDGCIEPFELNIPNTSRALVVDGRITDQYGPYTVKLYETSAIEDQLEHINWTKGAVVELFDDQDHHEILSEISPGNYQTSFDGMKGEVGRTYFIKIKTKENNQYESIPEKLLPVGEIENLYYEFELNVPPTPYTKHLTSPNGFRIFTDSEVLPEQGGLVLWRWHSIFEIASLPQLRTKPTRFGPVPDPPKCSGFDLSLRVIGECTCCNCWIEQYNQTPLLSDEKFTGNEKINRNEISFIEATKRNFYDKFFIEVEQLSVSKKLYTFWKAVKKQKQEGSNLFQTPPGEVLGNINTITEGVLPAIGFFSASSIRKKSLMINRKDVPYYLPPIDTLKDTCLKIYPKYKATSTNVKPWFW